MKLCRHVPIQQIKKTQNTKLNKVAVENKWNPDEIKWKETSSNKVKQHATNQRCSQENQVQTTTNHNVEFNHFEHLIINKQTHKVLHERTNQIK